MTCREAGPLLHARLDNELDMAGAAGIDLHLSECRACAAQYQAIQDLHEEIVISDLAYAPSTRLEKKLEAQVRRPWNRTWLNTWALAAAAAVLLIVSFPSLRSRGGTDAITAEILDDHLRSLQPMHPVDVPSSDQHTVKPWFQGKLSFSPPVPDLSKDDFILVGGRLDVIRQQPAAAVVYRRRQHVVSLYVAASPGPDSQAELHDLGGYHMLHWVANNLSYWAVSDVDPNDLRKFADLIREK